MCKHKWIYRYSLAQIYSKPDYKVCRKCGRSDISFDDEGEQLSFKFKFEDFKIEGNVYHLELMPSGLFSLDKEPESCKIDNESASSDYKYYFSYSIPPNSVFIKNIKGGTND